LIKPHLNFIPCCRNGAEAMYRLLVVIMIVVPALEIWGLFTIGKLIGGWQTFFLLLLTGFTGAWMARREGRRVWEYAQYQMRNGQVPTDSILDGICIFAGGLLLLTPGFLTDILGFLLVFPLTRPVFKAWALILIRRLISQGNFQLFWRR
jgi:UPF0716 protein FxsA